ncbi:MAG TPA: hypothetical protein P5084_00655 [Paludibacter sp.]|nr:hypothetical protein [Paludibacter sp.]
MSALLHIISIQLVPIGEISANMTDSQITALAETKPREKHTPGSATLSTAQKPSASGQVYQSEVSWSIPKMITQTDSQRITGTGAILLKTIQGQNILIYRNDVFQNTRLRPAFDSTTLRTQISFNINTVKPLF